MIKVNLISKKRIRGQSRNWSKIITYSLFGVFAAYFLVVSLYVVIKISLLKKNVEKVENESVLISNEMIKNSDQLSKYVLTKYTLSKIEDVNKNKFRYKDYLDQVSAKLTNNNQIRGVDFANKGWMVVTVFSPNYAAFSDFQSKVLVEEDWKLNNFFSGVYVEGVSRDKNGGYVTRLEFQLKNVNG